MPNRNRNSQVEQFLPQICDQVNCGLPTVGIPIIGNNWVVWLIAAVVAYFAYQWYMKNQRSMMY